METGVGLAEVGERPRAEHTRRAEAEEGCGHTVEGCHDATVPLGRAGAVESVEEEVAVCPEKETAQGGVEVVRRAAV